MTKKKERTRDEIVLAAATNIGKAKAIAVKVFGEPVETDVVFAIYDCAQVDAAGAIDFAATEADVQNAAHLTQQIFGTRYPEVVVEVLARAFED